jgi:uncharacterized protein
VRVLSLRRYPVKSMLGEQLTTGFVESRGMRGDRVWSVRDPDGKLGSGKSTKRFRKMDGLLSLVASYDGDTPVIGFPDGRCVRGDDEGVHQALSAYVGRPVTLARETEVSHFDEGPLHLVTTSALDCVEHAHGRPVDPKRLRMNLVLETDAHAGFVEDTWTGRRLAIGDALVIEVRGGMSRCVMLNLPQRDLPADEALLGTVTELNAMNLGVVADVVAPGPVSVGDAVRLLP